LPHRDAAASIVGVGSTNLASIGAAALESLHGLVYAAARRVEQHLRPLVDGLHRLLASVTPQPRLPSPPSAEPAPALPVPPGAAPVPPVPAPGRELPRAYGLNRVVLLARDPWWLFAHWEISPVERIEALRTLGAEGESGREVLRVHGPEGDGLPPRDIDLEPGAGRLHFRVDHPGRAYRVEVGLRTTRGRFVALVSSNAVTTPAAAPSSDLSVRWVAVAGQRARTDVAGTWSGRRLPVEPPAREDDHTAPGTPSSAAVLRGPRASDALPRR
jgi:hypothetical protein